MINNILFIQTGGTIDKDYPHGAGAYDFEIADPAVQRILDQVNPSFDYRVLSLLKKDSIDLTDEDRALIVETCEQAGEDHIIITHGTDTMDQTGAALQNISGKTIVITGSLRPERFTVSDAHFTVGTAVGALSVLQAGVYIAMSGQISSWDSMHKDPRTGTFYIS